VPDVHLTIGDIRDAQRGARAAALGIAVLLRLAQEHNFPFAFLNHLVPLVFQRNVKVHDPLARLLGLTLRRDALVHMDGVADTDRTL
jgi:hypothetical protein